LFFEEQPPQQLHRLEEPIGAFQKILRNKET